MKPAQWLKLLSKIYREGPWILEDREPPNQLKTFYPWVFINV